MASFQFKTGFGMKSARKAFATRSPNNAWAFVRHEMTNYGLGTNSRAYANQGNFDAWKAFSREIGRRCGNAAAAAIEAYIAEKAAGKGLNVD